MGASFSPTSDALLVQTVGHRLRVGILVDGPTVYQWVASTLEAIIGSGLADTFVWVGRKAFEDWPSRQEPDLKQSAALRCCRRLDYVCSRSDHDAFRPVDLSTIIYTGGPTLRAFGPTTKKYDFSSKEFNGFRDANLDVIVQLGSSLVPPSIAAFARYGLWMFPSTDNGVYGYETRLLKAVLSQVASIGIGLFVQHKSRSRILGKYEFRIRFNSLYENENAIALKAPEMFLHHLAALYRDGGSAIDGGNIVAQPSSSVPESNASLTQQLLRWLPGRIAARAAKGLLTRKWFIAYRSLQKLQLPFVDMRKFRIIETAPSHFYADPFVIERNGISYILFEDYNFDVAKGVISSIAVDLNGDLSEPEEVLRRDYHLSYPFLFEWQDQIYLMPETRDNGTIEVYQTDEFPRGWKLYKVLMRAPAVDSTLLQRDDKWWLFTWKLPAGEWNGHLLLFHAHSPFDNWNPHPRNPITNDPCNGRPAGALFEVDGQLIRPAQDCAGRYGSGICLNRVDLLSESEYQEVPVAKIGSDWTAHNIGTHTWNQDSRLQVVDGSCLIGPIPFLATFAQRRHLHE